jgi:hypothetical protein
MTGQPEQTDTARPGQESEPGPAGAGVDADSLSLEPGAHLGHEFDVGAADVVEPTPAAAETPPTADPRDRLLALSEAIMRHPDAASNYVLRGETLLAMGDQAAAAEDFRTGLELAQEDAESADWGYIQRALADRAREGLRRCAAR